MAHHVATVCVFCGSSPGADPAFAAAARAFGAALAREGVALVYGGGNVGLMGELADAALAGGGRVIGIIPHGLARKEVAHRGLTELHVVDSMHDRKAMMARLADAFVALPGGLGTLEEFFEVVTWAQLGIHPNPCLLLNVRGYYDRMIAFLDHCVEQALIKPAHREMVLVEAAVDRILPRLRGFAAPDVEKWISLGQS